MQGIHTKRDEEIVCGHMTIVVDLVVGLVHRPPNLVNRAREVSASVRFETEHIALTNGCPGSSTVLRYLCTNLFLFLGSDDLFGGLAVCVKLALCECCGRSCNRYPSCKDGVYSDDAGYSNGADSERWNPDSPGSFELVLKRTIPKTLVENDAMGLHAGLS